MQWFPWSQLIQGASFDFTTETNFQPGDIIAGIEPDEHVEIRRIAPFGSKTLIEGIGVDSRREIRRPLNADEMARLTRVRGSDLYL